MQNDRESHESTGLKFADSRNQAQAWTKRSEFFPTTRSIDRENDGGNRFENAKYMHENIPGSEMHIFKGKGHFPSVTAADKFNRILDEFVTTGKLLKD